MSFSPCAPSSAGLSILSTPSILPSRHRSSSDAFSLPRPVVSGVSSSDRGRASPPHPLLSHAAPPSRPGGGSSRTRPRPLQVRFSGSPSGKRRHALLPKKLAGQWSRGDGAACAEGKGIWQLKGQTLHLGAASPDD